MRGRGGVTANEAHGIIAQRAARTLSNFITKGVREWRKHPDATDESIEDTVYRMLRMGTPEILDIIDEENLVPKYKHKIPSAKVWAQTMGDIDAVIDLAEKDKAWKENLKNNIRGIADESGYKKDLMDNLEKAVDDTKGTEASKDLEYVLEGLEKMGYQRDATVVEERKKRKQREEEEKAKREEEKKKVEEEAKAAAERQKAEEEKRKAEEEKKEKTEEERRIEEEKRIAEGTNPDDITKKVEITFEDNGTASVEDSNFAGETERNTMEKKEESKGKAESKSKEETVSNEETAPKEEEFSKGETVGEEKSEEKSSSESSSSKEDSSEEKSASEEKESSKEESSESSEEADASIDSKHLDDEGNFIGESDSIDEQMKDGILTSKEVHVSDSNEDVAAINGTGEYAIETGTETLTGNSMSRYKGRVLKETGRMEKKVGKKSDDNMNNYYAWMDAAGIKLQNIIDHELPRILKNNPNTKVKFMGVKVEKNATNDYYMQNHLMLVVDYDDKINKGITKIHDESNGGVIESLGKKYLIIGVAGYGDRNASKLALRDLLWNPKTAGGFNLKKQRKQFFEEHPKERFYVNDKLSTEVAANTQIPGFIVRQMETDKAPRYRSVKELLADKSRNPYNYTMETAAWGIQELSKFLVVGTSLDNVMVPRNRMRNLGRAFVLMPASNGKLVPSYLKVLRYTEMKDGTLKDRIDALLMDVVSPNYKTRIDGIVGLMNILYFHKEGDYILAKKNKAEIALVHDGKVFRTFVLDSSFDRAEFKRAFEELNPRINVTARVLGNMKLLNEYDEAGALMTDAALFGTAGSSFAVWGLDGKGEMLKPKTVENDVPKSDGNSDYRKEQSQVIFNRQYYREENGVFSLDGETVTDEKILKQLRYNKMIADNGLVPAESKGVWEYYILSEGEHPQVIRVQRNTKEVRESSEEQARKFIDKINEEKAKKQREKEAKKVLEEQKGENLKPGELEDNGITMDEETGEAVQRGSSEETLEGSEETKADVGKTSKGAIEETRKPVSEEARSTLETSEEKKNPTQKFEDLYNNRKFKTRLIKLFKGKWKEAPTNAKELEKFLRGKNVEIDSIGTSKEDVEAWMKTVKECR